MSDADNAAKSCLFVAIAIAVLIIAIAASYSMLMNWG